MGTSHNRSKKRPGLTSKSKKVPGCLGWSEEDRNHSTLKKIEKAIQEEKNLKNGKTS